MRRKNEILLHQIISKMKKHEILMIGIILMIGVIGITSCSGKQKKEDFTAKIETNSQEKNVVTKIEVKKVDFDIATIIHVDCLEYEHFFNSEIQTCIIENKDSIQLFMDIICNLQQDTVKYDFYNDPDVRAKLLITIKTMI
jgi:Flp pilus assembly protein CpaB